MSITRRLFLRSTAAAGAAATVAVPVAQAARPEMTSREQAKWHMEELERLTLADGASEATIIVCGHAYGGLSGHENGKSIALHPGKKWGSIGGMFAVEGAAS